MDSNKLLDALKTATGAATDNALARQVLKVDPTTLRAMRERGLSDARAVQIATILELDPAQVLAWVHAERAQDPQVRKIWEKLAKSLVASLIVVGLWAISAPQKAAASIASRTGTCYTLCAHSQYASIKASPAVFCSRPAGWPQAGGMPGLCSNKPLPRLAHHRRERPALKNSVDRQHAGAEAGDGQQHQSPDLVVHEVLPHEACPKTVWPKIRI